MYSPSTKKPVYAILELGQITQIKNELEKDNPNSNFGSQTSKSSRKIPIFLRKTAIFLRIL
jgi:hypothetical protein